MEYLFYILASYILFNELLWVLGTKQKVEKQKHILSLLDKNTNNKQLNNEETTSVLLFLASGLLNIAFIIGGIFTFQYYLFVAYLVFIILSFYIVKSLEDTYLYIPIIKFKSFIDLAFVTFVIINKYHLRIDLLSYFI